MGSFAEPYRPEGQRRDAPSATEPAQVSPEDVFLAWLLRLPARADVARAAEAEIARLDRAAPLSPRTRRLRELFVQAVRPPCVEPRRRANGKGRIS